MPKSSLSRNSFIGNLTLLLISHVFFTMYGTRQMKLLAALLIYFYTRNILVLELLICFWNYICVAIYRCKKFNSNAFLCKYIISISIVCINLRRSLIILHSVNVFIYFLADFLFKNTFYWTRSFEMSPVRNLNQFLVLENVFLNGK